MDFSVFELYEFFIQVPYYQEVRVYFDMKNLNIREISFKRKLTYNYIIVLIPNSYESIMKMCQNCKATVFSGYFVFIKNTTKCCKA